MNLLSFVVLLLGIVACSAAPGQTEERKIGVLSHNAIEKGTSGVENSIVNFETEPLRTAARYYSEARGKLKKYTGIGLKLFAVVAIIFGGLSLLVTKALLFSKFALLVVVVLAFRKFLLTGFDGKQYANYLSANPQWTATTAAGAAYPYVARSLAWLEDAGDLAYNAQKPS